MAKFSYTRIPGSKLYRPLVDIQFSHPQTGKATPQIQALIDSGADICMAPHDIALWLGLEFDGSEEIITFSTANDSLSQAIKKEVILTTPEGRYHCPVFFMNGMIPDRKPLLGQLGFFDHFKICFDFREQSFQINRISHRA